MSLSEEDQRELRGHIQVFLAEKSFEGCGGLEVTNEMRVTVAAAACVLLLHRDVDYYPKLYSILIYPRHFFSNMGRPGEGGLVSDGGRAHLGESWSTGSIVLSWQSVKAGVDDVDDGQNVVFHEFTHQLDLEDGEMTGAPSVGKGLPYRERREKFASWAKVMSEEFEQLQLMERHGKSTLIDTYGSQSPAEFFAVCVEAFFERAKEMRERHPELYSELKDYFRQDPAGWKFDRTVGEAGLA